ncbi:nucleotidyltransferase-like protein [Pontibacter mucosus]|uniref:Nucleotidyltransferase-like protein n=1 Tax=Pontibacter mucosus TaxID=1649266 RepID=A0A2T5YFJ3_9BACT|nr:phosphotransferase [Pontibacter mucosus]PTX18088.1 nucleotidyltransferase-like protein [Pontibacter mucosus]
MHKSPTLLVLAAGMASRYGSLKQLDAFGPNGETIIEYSIHDAVKAGFGKVVFVIRESIEKEFKALMQERLPAHIPVAYVAQELDMLPEGYHVPEGRSKPWGTAHAVWVASSSIQEPFAVINADDFYGYESFKLAADFLQESSDAQEYGLIAYTLANTLSDHGSVSRGICTQAPNGTLASLTELTQITRTPGGSITVQDEGAQHWQLTGEELVSMNLMAFKPSVLPYFGQYLKAFLDEKGQELKSEFYLPSVVNQMLAAGTAQVKVIPTPEKWFGVTYPEDKANTTRQIAKLIEAKVYPSLLWENTTQQLGKETDKQMDTKLRDVLAHFALEGGVSSVILYGSGHIHDTYAVKNSQPECPDYLLQRVNHHVFKNVPLLMENIEQVTEHLRQKLQDIPGARPEEEVLTLVPTQNNQSYYHDPEGNFWRVYLLLEGTRSYDIVETPQQAFEGGKAFGRFLALLADLDATQLHDSIPDFHNIENRLRLLAEAVKQDPVGRVAQVSKELGFVQQRAEEMSTIRRLGREGKLPLRTTHNDTKFNNVLLDKYDKALCVIDLDTVMPGYVAYDFGDAIRTTVNKAAEDEADLSKIKVDYDLFKAFTEGFLQETNAFLTEEEVNSLEPGVRLLPFIMGVRFLTDYIDGDNYYKIHFPEHNLQRARAQFRLVEVLEENRERLQNTIQKTSQAYKAVAAEQLRQEK